MINVHPGETLSPWIKTDLFEKELQSYSKLKKNINVDVCVVGGGIAGLTTAYLLMKEDKRVCVLEAFELASGQSGRTTAQFTAALDERYFEIERIHGLKGSQLAAESHIAALEKVANIVREENIDCEFERVDGYLFAAGDPRQNLLEQEYDAIQKAGLFDVEFLDESPLDFDTGPCLKFPKQIQLHPVKYLHALARAITSGGGQIYTHTHVVNVEGGNLPQVKTKDGYAVNCHSIVVATHSPTNNLFAIHTKQAPYRTYVVGARIPKGSVPRGLYWDTLDPYHYIRLETYSDREDLLIVGGEDHKTGQEKEPHAHFEKLEHWVRERFPMTTGISYRWSGQIMEPVDGIAYLGHNPLDRDNVYVITGDSGNGTTFSTIGAMLITDQISGRKNEWEQLYDPSRVRIRGTSKFLKENSNVAAQYGEWFAAKPEPDVESMRPDTGVVFRKGLKMVAAYKDKKGKIEYMSAACTHLKGVVTWNDVEKSWDCPCHGSRFDCHGKVIEGPAFMDLKKLDSRKRKPPQTKPLPDDWISLY